MQMALVIHIWKLKTVSCHYSYASFDYMKETLNAMFLRKVPHTFAMSSSDVFNLILEATGPYFHELLKDDSMESHLPYTFVPYNKMKLRIGSPRSNWALLFDAGLKAKVR